MAKELQGIAVKTANVMSDQVTKNTAEIKQFDQLMERIDQAIDKEIFSVNQKRASKTKVSAELLKGLSVHNDYKQMKKNFEKSLENVKISD